MAISIFQFFIQISLHTTCVLGARRRLLRAGRSALNAAVVLPKGGFLRGVPGINLFHNLAIRYVMGSIQRLQAGRAPFVARSGRGHDDSRIGRSAFHWTLTYATRRRKRSKRCGTIKSFGLSIGPLDATRSKQASKQRVASSTRISKIFDEFNPAATSVLG
jgi:hypothetical protein